MELKGSKTEQNLHNAYASECKARTKYEFFAAQARKENYQQIAALFDETARNEKEHAEMWYKAMNGGSMPETTGSFPAWRNPSARRWSYRN